MGFLEKAKARMPSGFGDETVRVVNYGKEEEEKEIKPQQPRQPRPEKPAKDPKPPRAKSARPQKPQRPQKPAPQEEEKEPASSFSFDTEESSFTLDDGQQDFYKKQQEKYEKAHSNKSDDLNDLKVNENKIKDVLEVLQIPATFAIESDVFLPEDLEEVVFDLQAPFGFEQGQVNTFKERTKVSVKRYVELLRLRNEHVAKLASVVDRLQVDANNLRFQNEISSGINVMPTTDSEDLENELLEAKLRIKRLEDQIRTIEHGDGLSSDERKTFEDLQDNFSILKRENDDLKEEIYNLKNQLAFLEEEDDLPTEVNEELPTHIEEPNNHAGEEDYDLPLLNETVKDNGPVNKIPSSSAFYIDEDDNDAFTSSAIELIGDDYSTSNASGMLHDENEDDDDELDALMRDWNKGE